MRRRAARWLAWPGRSSTATWTRSTRPSSSATTRVARQASDRRRDREAERRVDGVVRGAEIRGSLGDARLARSPTMSAGDLRPAADGRLRGRIAQDHGGVPRVHAARGAAVARRGVPRRDGAAPRCSAMARRSRGRSRAMCGKRRSSRCRSASPRPNMWRRWRAICGSRRGSRWWPGGTEVEFLAPLPVARLWGAGKVDASAARKVGIEENWGCPEAHARGHDGDLWGGDGGAFLSGSAAGSIRARWCATATPARSATRPPSATT